MESSEPKKYPPTAKKLRDLKKKGQFPKTELAQPTLELVVFTLVFIVALYLAFEHINQWIEMMLYADVSIGLSSMMAQLWWAIAGLVGLKLVITLLNWVVLNKTVVNTEALGFKIEKINPVNGFKNIFGLEAMSRALRKVLELLFLLFFVEIHLRRDWGRFDITVGNEQSELFYLLPDDVYWIVFCCVCCVWLVCR